MEKCDLCESAINDTVKAEYMPAHQECLDAYRNGKSFDMCIICSPPKHPTVRAPHVYCEKHYELYKVIF